MKANIGIHELAAKLYELNRANGHISYIFLVVLNNKPTIITDLDREKAIFPEGYYFSDDGITNQNSSTAGPHEAFPVFTLVKA